MGFTSCSSHFLNNSTSICSACQVYGPYVDSKLFGEPHLKWLRGETLSLIILA